MSTRNKHRPAKFRVGSACSIYSRSKKQWLAGSVKQVVVDRKEKQEWLVVRYGNNQKKKIQRFCPDFRACLDRAPDSYTFHFAGLSKPRTSKYTLHHNCMNNIITVASHLLPQDKISSLKSVIRKTYKIPDDDDVLILYAHHIISDKNSATLKECSLTDDAFLLLAIIAKRNPDDHDIELEDDVSMDNLLPLTPTAPRDSQFYDVDFSFLMSSIQPSLPRSDDEYKDDEKDGDNDDDDDGPFGVDVHEDDNAADRVTAYTDKAYEEMALQAVKGFDIVMQRDDALCYPMPCGHLMNRDSLFDYVESKLKDGQHVHVTCPHANPTHLRDYWPCPRCTYHNELHHSQCVMCEAEKPDIKPYCRLAWQYKHIKKVLMGQLRKRDASAGHLNLIERLTKLELVSARNKFQKDCNAQKCPECNTLHVRRHAMGAIRTKSDLAQKYKTKCVMCSDQVEFCFGCGEKFVHDHICDDSFQVELVKILQQAELKKVGAVELVPSIRCCPKCCQLIYHTEACKHMDCKSCGTDFCFICLKSKKNGDWQCGDACPAAPRQNRQTLPDAIVVHTQTFKLF